MKKLLFIFFTVLMFISCRDMEIEEKPASVSIKLPAAQNNQQTRSFSSIYYSLSEVASYQITLSNGIVPTVKESKAGETILFKEIPAGIYTVSVAGLLENGETAASGTTTVIATAGETTEAVVLLKLHENPNAKIPEDHIDDTETKEPEDHNGDMDSPVETPSEEEKTPPQEEIPPQEENSNVLVGISIEGSVALKNKIPYEYVPIVETYSDGTTKTVDFCSNFSSYEIEDSKFINSVHDVEYEIIGEIPDVRVTKKGTGISTTATFVNKYSFVPSIITIEKNYDYENQSAELSAIVESEAPEYYFAMDGIVERPWNYIFTWSVLGLDDSTENPVTVPVQPTAVTVSCKVKAASEFAEYCADEEILTWETTETATVEKEIYAVNASTFEEFKNAIENELVEKIIVLNSMECTSNISLSRPITIEGITEDVTLERAASNTSNDFVIVTSNNVVLSNLIISGNRGICTTQQSLLKVYQNGSSISATNVKFIRCPDTTTSAVFLQNCTADFVDCVIGGSEEDKNLTTGLYMDATCTVTYTGGEISYNEKSSANYEGGGIGIKSATPATSDCTFKNVIIRNNKYSGTGGAGVHVNCSYGSSSIEFDGCTIEFNTCTKTTSTGGGVYISMNNGTAVFKDTDIKNNTSVKYGGGIASKTQSSTSNYTLSIDGGEISGNVCTANETCGGGIYTANGSNHTINIGQEKIVTIKNNQADSGGGIYFYGKTMNIYNAEITGNSTYPTSTGTSKKGGGIFASGYTNTLNIKAPTKIHDNTLPTAYASSNGSQLYVETGSSAPTVKHFTDGDLNETVMETTSNPIGL